MATRFGVLGLAETKCGSPQDESDWARDFPNRKDVFWASSGRAAAGVALFISNRAGAKELKVEYRDPMARIIAVSGMFRGTRMVVVVIHAETLPEYQKGSHDAQSLPASSLLFYILPPSLPLSLSTHPFLTSTFPPVCVAAGIKSRHRACSAAVA